MAPRLLLTLVALAGCCWSCEAKSPGIGRKPVMGWTTWRKTWA